MAKATTTKLTMEQRITKSLTTAARTLNKTMHKPVVASNNLALDDAANGLPLVQLFQVFCPDEKRVIRTPTTDEDAAREFRDEHNLIRGHNSRVPRK